MQENVFVAAAGASVPAAIQALIGAVRALWSVHRRGPDANFTRRCQQRRYIVVPRQLFSGAFKHYLIRSPASTQPGLDFDRLEEEVCSRFYICPESEEVEERWFHGVHTLETLLGDIRRPAELKYALMRDLRLRYEIVLSSLAAETTRLVADAARAVALNSPGCELELGDLLRKLYDALPTLGPATARAAYPRFLIDVCGAIGALSPGLKRGSVCLDTDALHGEYLLNHCFGLPTSIPGFDDLFGGSGLLLPDAPAAPSSASEHADSIGARLVLTIGPFGTGKSLLSLQMAVEIARKGGIAWLMAFEQNGEECRYALEGLGISINDPAFTFVSDSVDAFPALAQSKLGHGALVFLPTRKKTYEEFIKSLQTKLDWLHRYPLRLLIIDPFNAVYSTGEGSPTSSRALTIELLQHAKKAGVNIWMTSEEFGAEHNPDRFEENIADTVLRVGLKHQTQPQRFIEVTKSRLQRERSGRHVLTIGPVSGIEIHPEPSGYLGGARRSRAVPNLEVGVGVPGLNEILGKGAVRAGDIVALHGFTGTFAMLIGGQFLRATEDPSPDDLQPHSLFVADLGEARMRELVTSTYGQKSGNGTRPADKIVLLPINPGCLDPGRILLEIQRELARPRPSRVDRLVIANLSRWELETPHIEVDRTFILALIELLRRYGATSVIISGGVSETGKSEWTELLLENADTAIEFVRLRFRGQDRYFVEVLKTHQMLFRRGRFEVIVTEAGVEVRPKESLLRVDPAGNVHTVPIRLFLHSETLHQRLYNNRVAAVLRTALSPKVDVNPHSRRYDPNLLSLGFSSGVDEVQILQFDEFQIPYAASREEGFPLYRFPMQTASALLDDRFPRFYERACYPPAGSSNGADAGMKTLTAGPKESAVIAIPFYENISLLSYRADKLGQRQFPTSWDALIGLYQAWLSKQAPNTEEEVFFACHVARTDRFESYNCLFLEILYSLQAPPENVGCSLYNWLAQNPADTKKAMAWFRTLVRPSHRKMFKPGWKTMSQKDWEQRQVHVTSNAVVVRHWYNTLNQMLTDYGDQLQDIQVHPLFGRGEVKYMTTAGEWYLAVPSYSAAPDVALGIIEYLTTADEELERVQQGIGLPTRQHFYEVQANAPTVFATVSPFFSLNPTVLGDLVGNAFRRSRFHCYQMFADTLSSHLHRLLDLPEQRAGETRDGRLDEQMEETISSLMASIEFVRSRGMCDFCQGRH
jgi:KaiC/GvpD/RAD55 family RecA-like ATPase